jgi:hypothetical protein
MSIEIIVTMGICRHLAPARRLVCGAVAPPPLAASLGCHDIHRSWRWLHTQPFHFHIKMYSIDIYT